MSKQGAEQAECFEKLLDFHSYRLVKSVFNFGKASIYFGLWNLRYVSYLAIMLFFLAKILLFFNSLRNCSCFLQAKANPNLLGDIFNSTLNSYNDPNILGVLGYDDLQEVTKYTFTEFSPYMNLTRADFNYEVIPSLKCPTTCAYDLLSWQTLFYTSLAVFVLALIAVGLYSIFLYKQYQSLKRRLKATKNSKSNLKLNESN